MDDYAFTRTQAVSRQTSSMRLALGAVLVAFLLGAAGMWYLAGGRASLGELFSVTREAPAASSAAPPAAANLAGSTQQDEIDQRVAQMEQRLARLDIQAQAAAGNAGRAESLLIVFAARRAVERGAQLGYLEEQLRMRFGSARPAAVQTLIEAAGTPVTLDRLLARLDGLAPRLAQAPAGEGPFDWLSRQAGSLFVVRREDSPSPAPEQRVERARLFLESGRVDAAVAEVRMMPNADQARDWIADAERYAGAQRALETLEMAAILEPTELRDGAGQVIGQPSPVPAP